MDWSLTRLDTKDILDMGKRANQYISKELFLDAYPSEKRIEEYTDTINNKTLEYLNDFLLVACQGGRVFSFCYLPLLERYHD